MIYHIWHIRNGCNSIKDTKCSMHVYQCTCDSKRALYLPRHPLILSGFYHFSEIQEQNSTHPQGAPSKSDVHDLNIWMTLDSCTVSTKSSWLCTGSTCFNPKFIWGRGKKVQLFFYVGWSCDSFFDQSPVKRSRNPKSEAICPAPCFPWLKSPSWAHLPLHWIQSDLVGIHE